MIALLCFVMAVLAAPFKSKSRLEAENAVLRHQLIVLRRKVPGRVRLTNNDRWFFIQLYRWVPSILKVLTIIRPETLVRWHRAGFRCYRRWKSDQARADGCRALTTSIAVEAEYLWNRVRKSSSSRQLFAQSGIAVTGSDLNSHRIVAVTKRERVPGVQGYA